MLLNAKSSELLVLASAPAVMSPSMAAGAPVEILAYTGGLMFVPGHGWVVVDLTGCEIQGAHPLLADHGNECGKVIGQASSRIVGNQILTSGRLTDVTDQGKKIVSLHKTGFTFQASIGLLVKDRLHAPPGAMITANGQQLVSPAPDGCWVVSKSKLREVSVTPLGCDPGTVVTIQARQSFLGASSMTFEDFVKSLGLDPATITPELRAALERSFASMTPPSTPAAAPVAASVRMPVRPASSITVANAPAIRQTTVGLYASDGPTTSAPTFETWLQSQGLDIGALTDQQKAALQMTFNTLFPGAPASPPPVDPNASARATVDLAASHRAAVAAETQRQHEVRTLCAAYGNPTIAVPGQSGQTQNVSLEAHAIVNNWTPMRTENHLLRASLPSAPNAIIRGGPDLSAQVIEASLAIGGKLANLERHFTPQVLDTASRQYPRGLGPQQLLMLAARSAGWSGLDVKSDLKGVLKAAFSTMSLPGILSNNMNKFLLQGYTAVEDVWRRIAAVKPVSDFKTITSYRMVGGFTFQKVGPGGELKHGTFGEETYTNKAETYGIMGSLTRQDIINDDLGAFTDMPNRIGRGAGLKVNDVFWTEFLDNSAFFTTGNKNYFTGGTTNLQSSSLQTAEQKFIDQTDDQGKPLGVMPSILLTPSAISVTARELYQSQNVNTGGSSTTDKVPNANVWAGKYRPEVSAYLGNSSYTGYSTTAWYLLADPADMPVIEVVFLNGVDAPTVESTDADFNTLGVVFRGFFDFGVSKHQYRGGVKSKGAA